MTIRHSAECLMCVCHLPERRTLVCNPSSCRALIHEIA
jgi:hypothetical protein